MKVYDTWHVCQKDRRENYSIPTMMNQLSILSSLSTNLWFSDSTLIERSIKNIPKFSKYYREELSDVNVLSRNCNSIIMKYIVKHQGKNRFDRWISEGRDFSSWSVSNLQHNVNDKSATFGYTCESLELMKFNKEVGAYSVLGQVDPGLEWYDVLHSELEVRGALKDHKHLVPNDSFIERIREEWTLADKIIVNSLYSKESLIKHGVNDKKINIVPLTFSGSSTSIPKTLSKSKVIKALFVGNISFAKGFYYFGEASKMLDCSAFEFYAAGSLDINIDFYKKQNWNVNLLGHLSHEELNKLYERCDVLVFPTLSEGFGMVQLEAMSKGLPVIATKCCGEVVQNGTNGYQIQSRNEDAIVEALLKFRDSSATLQDLSYNAIERVEDYSLEKVTNKLKGVLNL
ncbi:glycosyltransferase family 4 protein [Vibrio sp. E150_011]